MEINFNNFKLAQCIHGVMIWPTNDSVIGKCLPLYGEWSEGENIIMSEYISEGDTVIDIGANIGTTVLSMSKNVGKTGKVIAFEPQQLMSQCLNTNLTLNDITNVDVYNIALSSKDGWAKLNDSEYIESGHYGEAGISEHGTDIKTMKLDDLKLNSCSLIKLDIEGHEWEALKGGNAFLSEYRPVIYMEAKNDLKSTEECLKWLMENNWKCYWHYAFWYRNDNFKKNKDTAILSNVGVGVGDMNFLAIPEEVRQPNYLPEITNYKEKWSQDNYISFFEENNIEII